MGAGKALDYTRYFIFCANVLGSPDGSASSLSINPGTGRQYGPTFPDTTIRDDIRYVAWFSRLSTERLTKSSIHKLVLAALGVTSVAAVIGGSMGGMHTLEWPLCTPPGYVKNIIPIATSAYQGAWGISWGETQRQVICADATFNDGWYNALPGGQPGKGLGAARMIGMLTYRSCDSFDARFGRKLAKPTSQAKMPTLPTPPLSDTGSTNLATEEVDGLVTPKEYAAQNYLQYQADKFLDRFDANCYIHLTRKMDTHDVTRDRNCDHPNQTPTRASLKKSLQTIPKGALVIGVQSDLLFPLNQQETIAHCLPEASFVILSSSDGHDGFLLEFERLNDLLRAHLEERCAWLYKGSPMLIRKEFNDLISDSVFGELESMEC
jgi:homoserine O-acetyltransferase